MGIVDSIAGQLFGGGGAQNNVLKAVMSVLGNQQEGGLTGLVNKLKESGLGDIVNSWISTGKNLPITPEQIQQGLGSDMVTKLAARAGVSTDDIASHLAQLLPQVVDKLTPEGKIPQGDLLSKGMDLLKGLMK
jgi:uncharacterized protein YidB (DUF937 family)